MSEEKTERIPKNIAELKNNHKNFLSFFLYMG